MSPIESTPLEEIAIEPDAPLEGECGPSCEGEWENGTHSAAQESRGQKRKAETNIDTREPRKIRGVW